MFNGGVRDSRAAFFLTRQLFFELFDLWEEHTSTHKPIAHTSTKCVRGRRRVLNVRTANLLRALVGYLVLNGTKFAAQKFVRDYRPRARSLLGYLLLDQVDFKSRAL